MSCIGNAAEGRFGELIALFGPFIEEWGAWVGLTGGGCLWAGDRSAASPEACPFASRGEGRGPPHIFVIGFKCWSFSVSPLEFPGGSEVILWIKDIFSQKLLAAHAFQFR